MSRRVRRACSFSCFSLSRLRVIIDLNDTVWMVDGALGVGADSACTSCAFAVNDDCGLGRFAGTHRFAVFVLILGAGDFGVLVARERYRAAAPSGCRWAVSICTNSGRAATSRLTCSASLAW